MDQATKTKINEIARLMWNSSCTGGEWRLSNFADFTNKNTCFEAHKYWNMALVAYVECSPQHRDLLKYKECGD